MQHAWAQLLSYSAKLAKVGWNGHSHIYVQCHLTQFRSVVFISEITARAFIVADANKRRTLSRSDIAKALSKSDQFDFLIDIVPRDDIPLRAGKKPNSSTTKQVNHPLPDVIFLPS